MRKKNTEPKTQEDILEERSAKIAVFVVMPIVGILAGVFLGVLLNL